MTYQKLVLCAFTFIAILLCIDIFSDIKAGSTVEHVAIEIVAFLAAAIPCTYGLVGLINNFQAQELSFKQDISRLNIEKETWKQQAQSYLRGLSEAMEIQFEKWGFSAAEKDIALLILKGLSHKEIANARETSEKTVRQQAGSIYAKAGLEGKSQLSAFFLDDLQITSNS